MFFTMYWITVHPSRSLPRTGISESLSIDWIQLICMTSSLFSPSLRQRKTRDRGPESIEITGQTSVGMSGSARKLKLPLLCVRTRPLHGALCHHSGTRYFSRQQPRWSHQRSFSDVAKCCKSELAHRDRIIWLGTTLNLTPSTL